MSGFILLQIACAADGAKSLAKRTFIYMDLQEVILDGGFASEFMVEAAVFGSFDIVADTRS